MSAIDPTLPTAEFKASVEARLLELTAAGNPRIGKIIATGGAVLAARAHVEAVTLLAKFHANGRIARAVADGVAIDDELLLATVEARAAG